MYRLIPLASGAIALMALISFLYDGTRIRKECQHVFKRLKAPPSATLYMFDLTVPGFLLLVQVPRAPKPNKEGDIYGLSPAQGFPSPCVIFMSRPAYLLWFHKNSTKWWLSHDEYEERDAIPLWGKRESHARMTSFQNHHLSGERGNERTEGLTRNVQRE